MKAGAVYQIQESPPIWISIGPASWGDLENPSGREGYLLAHPMWFFGLGSVAPYRKYRRMLRQKNIELILLNNSPREHRFARALGFRSRFINQNMNVCEHRFRIRQAPKRWNAVYVAHAKPYKRIHLAAKVKDLFVVTYFWPDVRNDQGEWDLPGFEPRVHHADYNRGWLEPEQVAEIIAASRCGLALSRKEGAMLGLMEYLYSGLPVVSTRSLGGRDLFLDPAYSVVVDDKPNAVAAGVEEILERDLDPQFVRQRALAITDRERRKLFELCRELSGQDSARAEDYEAFHNKVWGQLEGIEAIRVI